MCLYIKLLVTCTVVASVFQPLESIDEEVEDFFPRFGGQVVEVSEDSAHLEKVILFFALPYFSELEKKKKSSVFVLFIL